MKRVLLIEDEVAVVELLTKRLQEDGYEITAKLDGASGLAEVRRSRPDLVILDLILPKLSGLDVCSEIRRDPQTRNIPVLMLTGRGDEADRVAGLEVGADDYMVKPFSLRELAARVRALLRRWDRKPVDEELVESEPERLQIGDLVLEPEERRVILAGKEVTLTPMEFRLFHLLASHPNKAFAREELLDKVWGESRHVTLRSVDTCFWRLREKLEKDPANAVYLKTVRGVGYLFSVGKGEGEGKVLPIRARSTSA